MIAYQGAVLLGWFGTHIFVVDLVGISFLREIGPLIVATLIAGRSGSDYAAQIGTMKVIEELDAIKTLGLSLIQLLVLPRGCGLVIAVPLLTVFADIFGVAGGALVALKWLDLGLMEFFARFEEGVALRHFCHQPRGGNPRAHASSSDRLAVGIQRTVERRGAHADSGSK